MTAAKRILLGVIGRPHGVRGLVRVQSYTADPAALVAYGPLEDGNGRRFTLVWRGEGIAALAELRDGAPYPIHDRDAAALLTNTPLYIARDLLPPPGSEEFYLADLVGLAAETDGAPLGAVIAVHDYGAGASIEIARDAGLPLIIPFTRACVPAIDLEAGRLSVVLPAGIEPEGAAA